MSPIDPYIALICAGSVVIVSYLFNLIANKSNIPSVLLLISAGVGVNYGTKAMGIKLPNFEQYLPLLGQIGLIMIVLEGALDLKISKEHKSLIQKASFSAVLILLISVALIGSVIAFFFDVSLLKGLAYAVPLSVVSSAIVIPSVMSLSEEKKEFMVYEATLSDIAGIMLFNYMIISREFNTNWQVAAHIGKDIVMTMALSVVFCYILVFLFSKITTQLKLFLIIAILCLMYSVGKKFHFSSLIIIFLFGLILNNLRVFFFGRMSKYLDFDSAKPLIRDFKMITNETAFVVRTFFFLIFGTVINLNAMTDSMVLFLGSLIVVLIFLIRILYLSVFLKSNIFPELFLSPRGLITVLLFYSIPLNFQIADFTGGILFFVIIVTNVIMMLALIFSTKGKREPYENLELGSAPTANEVGEIAIAKSDLTDLQEKIREQQKRLEEFAAKRNNPS